MMVVLDIILYTFASVFDENLFGLVRTQLCYHLVEQKHIFVHNDAAFPPFVRVQIMERVFTYILHK